VIPGLWLLVPDRDYKFVRDGCLVCKRWCGVGPFVQTNAEKAEQQHVGRRRFRCRR